MEVVAEEAEPRAGRQRHLEAGAAAEAAQRVAAKTEEHEVIGEQPAEEGAHTARARGAVGERDPGALHLGVEHRQRGQHPGVVAGDVAHLLHGVAQRRFERGEEIRIVDPRRDLDVEQRLARRVRRRSRRRGTRPSRRGGS